MKCEYPKCKQEGFAVGEKQGEAILCKPHEAELDKLLSNDELKASAFMLKVVINRIENDPNNILSL